MGRPRAADSKPIALRLPAGLARRVAAMAFVAGVTRSKAAATLLKAGLAALAAEPKGRERIALHRPLDHEEGLLVTVALRPGDNAAEMAEIVNAADRYQRQATRPRNLPPVPRV